MEKQPSEVYKDEAEETKKALENFFDDNSDFPTDVSSLLYSHDEPIIKDNTEDLLIYGIDKILRELVIIDVNEEDNQEVIKKLRNIFLHQVSHTLLSLSFFDDKLIKSKQYIDILNKISYLALLFWVDLKSTGKEDVFMNYKDFCKKYEIKEYDYSKEFNFVEEYTKIITELKKFLLSNGKREEIKNKILKNINL